MQAQEIAVQHGARDLTNFYMGDRYVEAAAWIVQAGAAGGDPVTARRVGEDANALADKILELRPSDKIALNGKAVILTNLANLYVDDMRPAEGMATAQGAIAAQRRLIAFDPGNTVARNNLSASLSGLSDMYWSTGKIRESIKAWEEAVDSMRLAARGGPQFMQNKVGYLYILGRRRADSGEFEAIPRILAEMEETTRAVRAVVPKDSLIPTWTQSTTAGLSTSVAVVRSDPQEALRLVKAHLPVIENVKIAGRAEGARDLHLYYWNYNKSRAEFMLGDYAAAEKSARSALDARKRMQYGVNFDAAEQDLESIQIALSLIGQGRSPEAAAILEPVVKRRRDLQSRNHGDVETEAWLAAALYAQSAIAPDRRTALLREAAALIDATSAEYRALYSTRLWRDRITQAQRGVYPWTGRGRN